MRAPIVISNAGARATFTHLLPQATAQRELLATVPAGGGCVTAYLGLRESPEKLGFRGENHWYFDSFDHDANSDPAGLLAGKPAMAYLSFPSLKDPRATRHTAEIIAGVPAEEFAAWRDTRWQRRGEEYEAFKRQLAAGLIARVERDRPGFAGLIEHVEVSTPLTVDGFAGYASGSFADLAGSPDRLRHKIFPTAVMPGLYLAGADTMCLGIAGAMMGGVFAAGEVLGPFSIPRIMASRVPAAARPRVADRMPVGASA